MTTIRRLNGQHILILLLRLCILSTIDVVNGLTPILSLLLHLYLNVILCHGVWRVSEDGLQWDRLDYQSNFIFTKRGQTATFNLASNRVSYSSLRLSIIAVRGTTETIAQLAEMRLFATQDQVLPAGLYYPTETITYTVGITEDFSIKPLSSGFQSYSISPELPTGITIDVDSGEISGTTSFSDDVLAVYSVVAMSSVTGTNSTATVSIIFTSCSGPTKTRLDLIKYNQLGSDRESWDTFMS